MVRKKNNTNEKMGKVCVYEGGGGGGGGAAIIDDERRKEEIAKTKEN